MDMTFWLTISSMNTKDIKLLRSNANFIFSRWSLSYLFEDKIRILRCHVMFCSDIDEIPTN